MKLLLLVCSLSLFLLISSPSFLFLFSQLHNSVSSFPTFLAQSLSFLLYLCSPPSLPFTLTLSRISALFLHKVSLPTYNGFLLSFLFKDPQFRFLKRMAGIRYTPCFTLFLFTYFLSFFKFHYLNFFLSPTLVPSFFVFVLPSLSFSFQLVF